MNAQYGYSAPSGFGTICCASFTNQPYAFINTFADSLYFFRTYSSFDKDDVNQYVLREYQKLSGEFVPGNVRKWCGYYDIEVYNKKLVKAISRQEKKIVCINDSNHEIDFEKAKKEVNTALERLLPERSLFERG